MYGPRLNFVLLKQLSTHLPKYIRLEEQEVAAALWCQEIGRDHVCFDMHRIAISTPEQRCLHKFIVWEWSKLSAKPWRDDQWPFITPSKITRNLKEVIQDALSNKVPPGTRRSLPDVQVFRNNYPVKLSLSNPELIMPQDASWGILVVAFDPVVLSSTKQRS